MALLLYSPKCPNCSTVIKFIQSNSSLQQIIQFHNVNTMGVPPQYARQISRVPTMLTKNGKMLVGNEIQSWLQSLLPNTITNCELGGGGCQFASLDGSDEDGNFGVNLDDCCQSLQPAMTPELLAKINQKVPTG